MNIDIGSAGAGLVSGNSHSVFHKGIGAGAGPFVFKAANDDTVIDDFTHRIKTTRKEEGEHDEPIVLETRDKKVQKLDQGSEQDQSGSQQHRDRSGDTDIKALSQAMKPSHLDKALGQIKLDKDEETKVQAELKAALEDLNDKDLSYARYLHENRGPNSILRNLITFMPFFDIAHSFIKRASIKKLEKAASAYRNYQDFVGSQLKTNTSSAKYLATEYIDRALSDNKDFAVLRYQVTRVKDFSEHRKSHIFFSRWTSLLNSDAGQELESQTSALKANLGKKANSIGQSLLKQAFTGIGSKMQLLNSKLAQ